MATGRLWKQEWQSEHIYLEFQDWLTLIEVLEVWGRYVLKLKIQRHHGRPLDKSLNIFLIQFLICQMDSKLTTLRSCWANKWDESWDNCEYPEIVAGILKIQIFLWEIILGPKQWGTAASSVLPPWAWQPLQGLRLGVMEYKSFSTNGHPVLIKALSRGASILQQLYH